MSDSILFASSEAELQELVDSLDWVSRRYSLLINIDKTKLMASDGMACLILIQNEQLAQVNTFQYLGCLITEDGEFTTEFRTRLNRVQAIGASLQKIWKSHNIPISTKIRLMKALVWPVATYGCESRTRLKDWERSCVFCGQQRKWVSSQHSWSKEWDAVKARKLAYYGFTVRKQGNCMEKEIMLGTMSGAHTRGRPHTAWIDNIKTWTGFPVEESIKMTEERDKRKKFVHGVSNPRIGDG